MAAGGSPTTSERGGCLEIPRVGLLCAPTGRLRPGELGTVSGDFGARTQRFRTFPTSVEGWAPQAKGRACFTFCPEKVRPGRGNAWCLWGGGQGREKTCQVTGS